MLAFVALLLAGAPQPLESAVVQLRAAAGKTGTLEVTTAGGQPALHFAPSGTAAGALVYLTDDDDVPAMSAAERARAAAVLQAGAETQRHVLVLRGPPARDGHLRWEPAAALAVLDGVSAALAKLEVVPARTILAGFGSGATTLGRALQLGLLERFQRVALRSGGAPSADVAGAMMLGEWPEMYLETGADDAPGRQQSRQLEDYLRARGAGAKLHVRTVPGGRAADAEAMRGLLEWSGVVKAPGAQ